MRKGTRMTTHQISAEDLTNMLTKLAAAQTLLNANCVAIIAGRKPVSSKTRLNLAEDAEELVHDTVDILYRVKAQNAVG